MSNPAQQDLAKQRVGPDRRWVLEETVSPILKRMLLKWGGREKRRSAQEHIARDGDSIEGTAAAHSCVGGALHRGTGREAQKDQLQLH